MRTNERRYACFSRPPLLKRTDVLSRRRHHTECFARCRRLFAENYALLITYSTIISNHNSPICGSV